MNALDLLTAAGARAAAPKSGTSGSGQEEAANRNPEAGEDAFAALLDLKPAGSSNAPASASEDSATIPDLSSEIGAEVPLPGSESLANQTAASTSQPASVEAPVQPPAAAQPVSVARQDGAQTVRSPRPSDPSSSVASARPTGTDVTSTQLSSPTPSGPALPGAADIAPTPGSNDRPALSQIADPSEPVTLGLSEVAEQKTQGAQVLPSVSAQAVPPVGAAGHSVPNTASAVSLPGAEVHSVEGPNSDGMLWSLRSDAGGSAPATQTATSAQPPTPSPQAVAAQIATTVTKTEAGTVVLRLDPPELGRVQIELVSQDEGLRATLLAERPETQDFLRRHAETLLRELMSAGHGNVTLDFAAGAEDQAKTDEQSFGLVDGAEQTLEGEESPARQPGPHSADGRLDIRL